MKIINPLFAKKEEIVGIMIIKNFGKEETIDIEENLLKKSFRGIRNLELNTNKLKDNHSGNGRKVMKSKLIRALKICQNKVNELLRN